MLGNFCPHKPTVEVKIVQTTQSERILAIQTALADIKRLSRSQLHYFETVIFP